jgi:hypothetical protein
MTTSSPNQNTSRICCGSPMFLDPHNALNDLCNEYYCKKCDGVQYVCFACKEPCTLNSFCGLFMTCNNILCECHAPTIMCDNDWCECNIIKNKHTIDEYFTISRPLCAHPEQGKPACGSLHWNNICDFSDKNISNTNDLIWVSNLGEKHVSFVDGVDGDLSHSWQCRKCKIQLRLCVNKR